MQIGPSLCLKSWDCVWYKMCCAFQFLNLAPNQQVHGMDTEKTVQFTFPLVVNGIAKASADSLIPRDRQKRRRFCYVVRAENWL